MEGEAAAHRLRQARVLTALPGEGQERGDAERGVADVVDTVGVFQIALGREPGQGLSGDTGEDGVVGLRGVREVVQGAELAREVHGCQPFMPEVAMPSTSLFWKMRKQMRVGRRASVDMANIAP